jgi:hypothetical protein
MDPPAYSRLNVPKYPLLVLLNAGQIATGIEQLALPMLDGVRPILEQTSLSGKGHDPFSRSVPAGERRRVESTTLHRHNA